MNDTAGQPNPEDLAARLLGPAEPELSCEECFAELDRYVEAVIAHLDAEGQVPGMRAHLEGCPACREDFQSLLDLLSGPQHQQR